MTTDPPMQERALIWRDIETAPHNKAVLLGWQDWRDWMLPDEAVRYAQIPAERKGLTDEARKIRNRAIQRMLRATSCAPSACATGWLPEASRPRRPRRTAGAQQVSGPDYAEIYRKANPRRRRELSELWPHKQAEFRRTVDATVNALRERGSCARKGITND